MNIYLRKTLSVFISAITIFSLSGCKNWPGGGNGKENGRDNSNLPNSNPEEEKFIAKQMKTRNAIQMTHHIIWVLACIKDLQDARDLEVQYNLLLADNLSYDSLDEETKRFAKDILNHINKLRIDVKERELLLEIYQQERRKAFFACLPSNMAVIVDANWKQLLANVVQTLFYSYMNYRKIKESLAIQYKRDVWALDRQKLNDMTETNTRQLDDLFNIYRKHRIPDRDIVKNADWLYKEVAMVDFGVRGAASPGLRFKVHDILKSEEYEREYNNFAMYWFYRGMLAYDYSPIEIKENSEDQLSFNKASDLNDAKKCFDKFQELTRIPVLTRDPIVAEVALRQIQLCLQESKFDPGKVKKQLNIIKNNIALHKDFDKYFFCGLVYYKYLKDYNQAAEMFRNAESILFPAFKQYADTVFCKNLKTTKTYDLKFDRDNKFFYIDIKGEKVSIPSSDLLFHARMARYYMMILAKNDANLAADISKAIDPRYDSPLAACFYGANVKEETTKKLYYKEILPKVFGVKPPPDLEIERIMNAPVGSLGLPYHAPPPHL